MQWNTAEMSKRRTKLSRHYENYGDYWQQVSEVMSDFWSFHAKQQVGSLDIQFDTQRMSLIIETLPLIW